MTDPNPYAGLRAAFLALSAEQLDAPLRGAALELGLGSGVASLVCAADGSTSIYFSGGGGYLGMGRHEAVQNAAAAFRSAVAARLGTLTAVPDVPLPGDGGVNVVAVMADGLRLLRCPEAEARDESSAAYPLYVAGQGVITQVRLAAEAHDDQVVTH